MTVSFVGCVVGVRSVDGQYLNYDNNALRTTDFTGLCAAMVNLQAPDKKIGKHSSVGTPPVLGGPRCIRQPSFEVAPL